jgi:hypothetical protein
VVRYDAHVVVDPNEANEFDSRLSDVAAGIVPPDPANLDEMRLAAFGVALRVPGRQSELAGLAEARRAFDGPAASGVTRARGRRRPVAAAAAGLAAVVMLSGVAAAAAGQLPTPLQRLAHSLAGAPKPASENANGAGADVESGTPSESAGSSGAHPESGSPAASPAGKPSGHPSQLPTPSAGSVGNSALGLCRAWEAPQGNVNPNSAIARSLKVLAGPLTIRTYCAVVLGTPGPSARPTALPHPVIGKPSTPPKPGA